MLRPSVYNDNFLEQMLNGFLEDPFAVTGTRMVSAMNADIKESDQGYTIDMELPGFRKEDVTAELKDSYLTIRAARETSNDENDDNNQYIRKERYSGHYQRSFYVGEEVTEEDIKAKYQDGILTVFIRKKEKQPEVEQRKVIQIEG